LLVAVGTRAEPHSILSPTLCDGHCVASDALIGLGALHRRSRAPAVAAGFVLAPAIWVVGQDLGQLHSGQATDPNTAPIIALLAIAILGGRRARVGARVGARGGLSVYAPLSTSELSATLG
jgi:hypothetical protein